MMQDQIPNTIDRGIGYETFDRVHGGLLHAQGGLTTKPSTVIATMPVIGTRTAYIVQSFKTGPHGHVISLEIMDAQGPVRVILPDKVAQAIYRQRAALADRSTPASRARKARAAEIKKARTAKAARRAKYAAQTQQVD